VPRIPNLRWWIAGMLAVATALNYLGRQSFPVVVRVVQRDIPISDREYSALQSAFLLAYSLMYAGGGRMVDRLGTRTGYTIIIIWWSVANFLHGLATSVVSLGVFRFFLELLLFEFHKRIRLRTGLCTSRSLAAYRDPKTLSRCLISRGATDAAGHRIGTIAAFIEETPPLIGCADLGVSTGIGGVRVSTFQSAATGERGSRVQR
jgi:MFS family permease